MVLKNGPDASTAGGHWLYVHNDRTYPNFIRFIRQLEGGTDQMPYDLFLYDRRAGFCFASAALLQTRKTVSVPLSGNFSYDILRFNRLTWKPCKKTDSAI
ncbi:MAG: hypothetical protein R2861_04435 [Desulfobacterales bacterium]